MRLLLADPVYSLVTLLGLGVGLGVFLLLVGFARYCWQYNTHVPDAEHVHVIKQRANLEPGTPWYDQAPVLLREAASNLPGVVSTTGFVNWFPLTAQVDGQVSKLRNLTTLPGFAEMLGLRAINGDLADALSRPDSLALTESAARRLFGTTDVLGRTVTLKAVEPGPGAARVAAILPDPPANTTIPFEALHGPKLSLVPQWMATEAITGEMSFPGTLFIRVRPDASIPAITEALQNAVDRAPATQRLPAAAKDRLGGRKIVDIKLAPLRDAYFDREIAINPFSLKVDRGNPAVLAGLLAIASLILALATLNYVNLATIRVARREREIAMRKVLGVKRQRLVLQFAAESLLVAMLATAIGLLLAYLLLPVFAQLMNRDLSSLLTPGNIAAAVAIGIVLGLLTALYPAWIAFGVRPSQVLAGRAHTESVLSKRLRQTLSVLQIAAAMGLASFTLGIYLQARFAMNASPGFDPSSLLAFEINEGVMMGESEVSRALITALSQEPAIAGVATAADAVGRSRYPLSAEVKQEGGPSVIMDNKLVSANFFEQYGIRPVAGRLFDSQTDWKSEGDPVVINALAARALGFASPQQAVGQTLLFRSSRFGTGPQGLVTKRVVGIAPEIRFHSLREVPRATAYEVFTSGVTVTVRASGSVADAERAVRTVWPQYYPNSVLELSPVKDIYAANYADDARLARLLALGTIIAMIIAAFGIYVLAADTVQRLTAAIAMRKLFGARRLDIGKLVARKIGGTVLLSAAIGLPIAALALVRYFAPYTERTPLGYWTLVFALIVTLAVAALAAARHAWLAMMLRPIVALRV